MVGPGYSIQKKLLSNKLKRVKFPPSRDSEAEVSGVRLSLERIQNYQNLIAATEVPSHQRNTSQNPNKIKD